MTLNWITHLNSELHQPEGWKIAGRVIGGTATVGTAFAAFLTWMQANKANEANSVSTRMAAIQTDVFSDSSAGRIAGLRSLASLDADAHAGLLGDGATRRRIDKFVQGALMDSIERLARPAEATEAHKVKASDDVTDIERYQLLIALDQIGRAEWTRDRERKIRSKANFSWLTAAKAVDDAVETIEPVANILDGFQFPQRPMVRFRFSCVSLQNADFASSQTEDVRFQFADMGASSFAGATLDYDGFSGASLRGVRFDQSKIEGTIFSAPTALTQSLLDPCFRNADAPVRPATTLLLASSFEHASILNTEFVAATATGASFRAAVLSNDNFNEASLEGVRFDGAKLSNVSFDRSRLNGASFDGASVFSASFDGTDLRNTHFVRARFGPAAIESVLKAADLRRANFGGATGVSAAQVCRLIARGAVVVADEARWEGADRQPETVADSQSAAERAITARCAHG